MKVNAKKINETATRVQTLFTLITVVVTLLNLYIASKLAPVAEDISVLATRVEAMEKTQSDTIRAPEFNLLVDSVDHIVTRVDRIYEILVDPSE